MSIAKALCLRSLSDKKVHFKVQFVALFSFLVEDSRFLAKMYILAGVKLTSTVDGQPYNIHHNIHHNFST